MDQCSVLTFTNNKGSSKYDIILVQHDTLEELKEARGEVIEGLQAFFVPSKGPKRIGSIHVSKDSDSLVADIIHESLHAACYATHKIHRKALNIKTEELLCKHFEQMLPMILDYYGLEIKPKE